MQSSLKQMDSVDLINLDRLAHIIRGLSPVEFETLEILLDKEATDTINQTIPPTKTGHFRELKERPRQNMATISSGNKFLLVAFSLEMPQAKRNSHISQLSLLYRTIT